MDAGSDAIGCPEFGHPDEHNNTEFLGPAKVDCQAASPVLRYWKPGGVAMDNGDKNDQNRSCHEK